MDNHGHRWVAQPRAPEPEWIRGAPSVEGDYYIAYEGPSYRRTGKPSTALGTIGRTLCRVYLASPGGASIPSQLVLFHIALGRRPTI